MRIFFAGVMHESSSVSPIPTTVRSFDWQLWQPRQEPEPPPHVDTCGLAPGIAAARARGHDCVAGWFGMAQPSAPLQAEAWAEVRDGILADLADAMPVDAVFLMLHGAQMAVGEADCEGDLLARVRALVGGGVPIGVELDLHTNLSRRMVETATAIIACKHYPHIDYAERAVELLDILEGAHAGRIAPVMAAMRVPVLGLFPTTEEPMAGFVARLADAERYPILSAKGANTFGQDQDDFILAPWTAIKFRVSGSALAKTNQSAGSAGTSATNTLSNLYASSSTSLYPAGATNNNSPMMTRFLTVDQIQISARTAADTTVVVDQVTQLLRERHHIGSAEPDDFTTRNLTEFANALSSTTMLMSTLLLTVAGISLVVGGVGIMNIMLVSVTERTREIGLRMAVGAKAADILKQFLIEAVVLSLTGGGIGILLGFACSYLVRTFLHWPTESSPAAVFAAVIVSATVGVAFGYYPAWKASRLDPIDALRYE